MLQIHKQVSTVIPVLLIALALRVFLLIKADWMADYDESAIGLMALGITQGEHPIFFAGQPYMGAVDAYLAAPLFALFGTNRAVLKLVPLAESLLWVLSTWVLARRLAGERAALIAGLAAAFAPLYVLNVTIKTGIGVISTMLLGNLAWLAALRLTSNDSHRPENVGQAPSPALGRQPLMRDAILFGLLAGIGFYWHWLTAYYLLAAATYIALSRPQLVKRPETWLAAPAFLAGSTPFWFYNVRHDWATFHYFLSTAAGGGERPAATTVLWDWLTQQAPKALGATTPALPWLAALTAIALAGALVWASIAALRDRRLSLIPLFLLTMPPLFLLSGYGGQALVFAPYGVDATGRYVVPLYAVAALALGVAFIRFPWPASLCVTVIAAVSVAGAVAAPADQLFQSPYFNRTPASFAPVIAALHEQGIDCVWTDVALAHPLMFQSGGRINAADYLDRLNGGFERFPDAYAAAEHCPRPAYLVAVLPGQVGPLEHELQRLGAGYRKDDLGRLALLTPDRRVDPSEVMDGLGYQY